MKIRISAKAKVNEGKYLSFHLKSNNMYIGQSTNASLDVPPPPALPNAARRWAEEGAQGSLVSSLRIQTLSSLKTYQVSDKTGQQ